MAIFLHITCVLSYHFWDIMFPQFIQVFIALKTCYYGIPHKLYIIHMNYSLDSADYHSSDWSYIYACSCGTRVNTKPTDL